MPKLLIGTSGYVYPHWRKGVFYPAGLPARRELEWYAERFPTVELNNPFYRLPEPATVERWRDAVPPTFLFAFKASRFITHTLRLRDSAPPLAELMARAVLLGPKRGPVLFQLPPTFPLDLPRLEGFVAQLDRDWRWVMEFRHPAGISPRSTTPLAGTPSPSASRSAGRSSPTSWSPRPSSTCAFMPAVPQGGGFEAEVLREWAGRLRGALRSGLDAYVYFNNDRDGHAVRDARSLTGLLQRDRSP